MPIYKSCCCWHTAPGSPTQTKLRCQPPPPPPLVVIVVPPQNTTVKMGTARALKRQLKGKCAVVVILCRKLYYFRGIYARYITHEDDRTKRLFIIIRFSCVVFSSKKRNNNNKTFKSQTHTCTLTKWWWCCWCCSYVKGNIASLGRVNSSSALQRPTCFFLHVLTVLSF